MTGGRTEGRAEVRIDEATVADSELVAALGALLPLLSSSPVPTGEEVAAIVGSPATVLLVARDAGRRIVGTLTLAVFRVPSGVRAWIEDVIVDESLRGGGIGAALVHAAIERARAEGARTVDLTSRPSREAANRLYQRLGFTQRETNVYRFALGK